MRSGGVAKLLTNWIILEHCGQPVYGAGGPCVGGAATADVAALHGDVRGSQRALETRLAGLLRLQVSWAADTAFRLTVRACGTARCGGARAGAESRAAVSPVCEPRLARSKA